MNQNQALCRKISTILLIIGLFVSSTFLWAQSPIETRNEVLEYSKGTWFPNFVKPFTGVPLPEVDFTNTDRVKRLIRDGKLNLALGDAIALALENNLDIAVSRYDILMTQVDLMRAKSGQSPRGVPGAPVPVGLFAGAIGGGVGSTGVGGGGGGVGGAGGAGVSATRVGAAGSFDPSVRLDYSFNRSTFPLNTTILAGVPTQTTNTNFADVSYSQYYQTGTSFFVSGTGGRQSSTGRNLLFNPQVVTSFAVGFNQHLLRGFGLAANTGFIRVAKNNIKISDAVFRKQVIDTVSRVINLYWDLVYSHENVKVARHSVELAQKLLQDNKTQVEIGTMAPIEVTRAEAEVARNQQRFIEAETILQQQDETMKQVITRSLDPTIISAILEPVDRLPEPKAEDIPDELAAIKAALAERPEIDQAKLNLLNQEIAMKSARNALLPSLDFFGFFGGSGLSGDQLIRAQQNPDLTLTGPISLRTLQQLQTLPPIIGFATGGLSRSLGRTFGFDFPQYAFGFSMDIPIRNRAAKSNYARALLEKRQAETTMQRLRNQVTQEVRNALIGLTQTKARVEAARKSRTLAEKTYEAEQLKFRTGVSTPFLVIQAQRDLISAQADESRALSDYGKALVETARVSGSTLGKARIDLEDAKSGEVKNIPQFSYNQ